MKKTILTSALTPLFIGAMALPACAMTVPVTTSRTTKPTWLPSNTAFFISPHQDDELLSMGADIEAHVKAGRTVAVILMTDGSGSSARSKMCADTVYYCLTVEQFIAARNREFIAGVTALGVKPSNIFFENLKDGGTNAVLDEQVLTKWAKWFPKASYKGESYRDLNVDHIALGNALRSMKSKGKIIDVRYYQFRPYWSTMPVTSSWFVQGGSRVKAAIAAYNVWQPSVGRFAIGPRYSVPPSFKALASDLRSKVHK